MTAEWTQERRRRAAENTRRHLREHGHPLKGKKRTAETRAKISESLKRSMTPERRAEISEAKKKSMTPEVRARMSEAAKRSMTPERRARMSEAAKKSMTPERRAKLSEAARRSMTPERKAEISEKTKRQLKERGHPMKGKKHTADSLAKMRAAHKKTYESMTPEDRAKLSEARKRAMTPEVRAKLSETKKKNMTPERKARLSEATTQHFRTHGHPMKGKHFSPEARTNMTKAQRKRVANMTPEDHAKLRAAQQKRAAHMTQEEKNAARDRLQKGRKAKGATIPEKFARYVLRKAGVEYEWQRRIEVGGTVYYVDVFVEPNTVIEADGDYWHGVLEKYGPDYAMPGGKTAGEMRARYEERQARMKSGGYKIISFLESEMKARTGEVVGRILDGCGAAVPDSLKNRRYVELVTDAEHHLSELEVALKRERLAKNKDHMNAWQRQNYHKHKEKIQADNRRRYADDHEYAEKMRANARRYNRKNKDKINSRNRAKWAGNEEYRNEWKARNRNRHEMRMSEIRSALAKILGDACRECGKTAGVTILTNLESCKSVGHVRARGVKMQYYVDNPADAAKFLYLVCPECARRAKSEASRKALTGRKLSAEHKAKIGRAGLGRKRTAATNAKISAANKGRTVSDETRAKLSAAAKSRMTPEYRAKLSESGKRYWTPERRERKSAAMTGRKLPEKTKAKMSEDHRRRS